MRGYRVLKQSGHLSRIADVKQELTDHPLGMNSQHFSSIVMGAGAASGEIIVRQYLLIRVGGVNLNRALLLALGKERGRVVFPLPREWRNILTRHNFEVDHFWSALLWQLYILTLLLYGVATIGKIAFAGIISTKRTVFNQKRYAYFADLVPGSLPQEINGSQSHDIISWYLQWSGRNPDIEEVHHNVANSSPTIVGKVAVLPQHGPLPAIIGVRSIINYIVWGLWVSFNSVINCLRGRWWHALLLNQAALAAQVRSLPINLLAQEYLFHNSGWIYRPLWTYDAERLGSAVIFYFYSTNCESFKKPCGYSPLTYGWKAMTWPHYLVWNEYQLDFVRRAVGAQANISVVGPIWFQSNVAKMPQLDKPGVAVFDVTPIRQSRYCILGVDYDFYIPSTCESFLKNIANISSRLDTVILWKRKRKIGTMSHPQYRYFADRLSERADVVLIDPDISAFRVIESSCAVISMPFTSTALIARAMGKPSIYYDPTGKLQRDDRAAHGIFIISDLDELETWLSSQLKLHDGFNRITQ